MENKERTSNTGASEARCPFSNPREIFNDFAETRHAEGLTYSEALNAWIVARYDDIVETLHQPNLYSSEATLPQMRSPYREMFEGHVPTRGTLLGLDNPDHDRLRLSVSSFFVPRRLKRLEPLIRREANALIDGFVASGQTNLKASLALPLPLKMITTIVGLDPERFIWVGESLAFFGGHPDLAHGTRDEQAQRLLELHAYISDVIEERRTVRRDDLIWECVAGLLHLRYSLGLNCTPAMKSFSLTPPAVAMKNISHTLTNWTLTGQFETSILDLVWVFMPVWALLWPGCFLALSCPSLKRGSRIFAWRSLTSNSNICLFLKDEASRSCQWPGMLFPH